jgi:RNA polymerase sigma-70 factor (ECF subfamily)
MSIAIYAFVSRRTGTGRSPKDITSQVFEQALRASDAFEWRGVPLAAWLYRIAANALADTGANAGETRTNRRPTCRMRASVEESIGGSRLYQQVDQLPDLQRQVIRMRFVEEKSIRDVRPLLERSEGAIKQLQLRALENLRKSMGGHG